MNGGEGGIRTPGTGLSQYNGLANRGKPSRVITAPPGFSLFLAENKWLDVTSLHGLKLPVATGFGKIR